MRKTLEKVESNYRGLLKGVEPARQEKILQNLAHVFTIIKGAYYSTENVADFSTKITWNRREPRGGYGGADAFGDGPIE